MTTIRQLFPRIDITPFTNILRNISRAVEGFNKAIARSDQVILSGWLPHATTPDFEESVFLDPAILDLRLEEFYRDNWIAVRHTLLSSVSKHNIDDEAKATFEEAINCHEAGFYRSVPRLIFPELERLGRITWHKKDEPGKMISSLHELQRSSGEVIAEYADGGGMFTYGLIEKLTNHMYKKLKTKESIEAISRDPVPNRHACIHGIVTYSTMKSSVNALIMADFAFLAVSTATTQREEK
ncbi:hypothetical protein J2X65_003529 [Ancylobacter sp. 3268]|uniref:hypothetical protein n=1 Tax=Ancylobacter sp. 3268 TaxID=2817752 RepID=UPI002865C316|nr:hypothetical protein [Ancylobacter sp. 3268]MDR6954161.1 hypothetical protein [Ancylobacter sp. 3268]